jgi:dUTP pyrophosphatase
MVIDSDYRGEIIVAIHNDMDEPQMILAKSRIAQLIILPYIMPTIEETEELDETARGDGGFGSTGTK